MASRPRQMSLGMNILGLGAHPAAWRAKETPVSALTDIKYFQEIARISERGTLDAIFLADRPSLQGVDIRTQPDGRLEPTILLTAIALATEYIGVIGTASTTYNEPFNIARRFSSLDFASGGRAGWNMVTNAFDAAAQNFNLTNAPLHVDRYDRALEFAEVVTRLWDSWSADAIVGDADRGIFANPEKIRTIDHHGKHFSVKGPLNLPRTPQGRPVVVQAGASEGGKALGARYAEAIFCALTTIEDGRAYYREMKQRARDFGRDPEQLKIMPGLYTVLGGTEEEAHARSDALDEYQGADGQLVQLAGRLGLSPKELDLDAELPWHKLDKPPENTSHGFFEADISVARRERLTVRQLLRRARGHRIAVGTPVQIADTLEEWFKAGAADGFNLMPDVFPSGVESFVDHVVPELRKRGVFRSEYTGRTLRDHLGLAVPKLRS